MNKEYAVPCCLDNQCIRNESFAWKNHKTSYINLVLAKYNIIQLIMREISSNFLAILGKNFLGIEEKMEMREIKEGIRAK